MSSIETDLAQALLSFKKLNPLSLLTEDLISVRKAALKRRTIALADFKIPSSHELKVVDAKSLDGSSVPIRIVGPKKQKGPKAFIIWLHGGGFVLGDAQQDDPFITDLSVTTGFTVASVDYRLAPENPYPKPLEDCFSALSFLLANSEDLNLDPDTFFIGGASAGGGLTAGLCIWLRDNHPELNPRGQLLIYPMLDNTNLHESKNGHGLDWDVWGIKENRFAWTSYLGRYPFDDQTICYAAASNLNDCSGLPPAIIITGDIDLFVSENIQYASKLVKAGVECDCRIFSSTYHSFLSVAPSARVTVETKILLSSFLNRFSQL